MSINHKKSLETFRAYLKGIDRKYTVEREEILRLIGNIEGMHTLPQLYCKARKKNAVHAKSTLYRNMYLFVDAGLINEIRMPDGKILYEPKFN